MMRLLITFLALIPLTVFAQKTDTTALRKKSIGFTFSPDYSYRTLKPDSYTQWLADYRDAHEIPKFGFTAGVNFNLKMSKRFSLETGVLLADKGEKTRIYSSTPPTSEPDPLLPIATSYNYHYLYLDIPIKANYYLLTGRSKFYFTSGISANFYLFQPVSTVSEYVDGHKERNLYMTYPGLSRINLAFLAGLGFEYDLSDKLSLRFEPIFRHSITSVNNSPIKGYLYSVGMNLGVYFSL